MISICEYSIRDYYGVSNIFCSVLFSSQCNTQPFSYHSKYHAVSSGSDFRKGLSLRTDNVTTSPQINC